MTKARACSWVDGRQLLLSFDRMDWLNFAVCSSIVVALMTGLVVWRAFSSGAGWAAWVCYQVARLQAAVYAGWSSTNACTYPETGAGIIVANHSSPVDPSLLWIRHFAQFKRPRLRVIGFLMAREYYVQSGIVGWVCRVMQSIPMDRSGQDMAPLRQALRRLQAGHLLGVFPEGRLNTVSPDTQLLPGGVGVAWLALRSSAPVIPVFIKDAPRSSSMVRAFFTRSKTTLTYGSPIDLSRWTSRKPDHDVLLEVTDHIMQQLANLGGILPTAAPHVPSTAPPTHAP